MSHIKNKTKQKKHLEIQFFFVHYNKILYFSALGTLRTIKPPS
jgi:hypothetical protein